MKNILTFDVEDWYHGLGLSAELWPSVEKRLPIGLEFILSELAARDLTATFFVLGLAALDYPDWVRRIAAAGHEVGTHGWGHTAIYRQTRAEFRAELCRSLDTVGSLSGQPVRGHRAAMFSVTSDSLWALYELSAAGLTYDSSIFPVYNYRYGIPGGERFPYRVGQSGCLWELPVSTARIAGVNVPLGGGFYARFWPYTMLKRAIRNLNVQGHPAVIYFHPWEFDPHHPYQRVGTKWLARTTHYYHLADARTTLQRLLTDFEWCGAWQSLVTSI